MQQKKNTQEVEKNTNLEHATTKQIGQIKRHAIILQNNKMQISQKPRNELTHAYTHTQSNRRVPYSHTNTHTRNPSRSRQSRKVTKNKKNE